jgi:hypothetical protein
MLSSFTGSFQAGKRSGTVEPFTANIVQSGLFSHYESSYPDSYPGTGTSWFDLKSNNGPAILQNGTDYSYVNNGVFVLDGIDDYITVPDASPMRGQVGVPFTIQLWVNVQSFNDKDRLFEKITFGAGYSLQLRNEGQLALEMKGATGNSYVTAGSTIPLNTWILVTAVIAFNGRSSIPSKVYVNGVQHIYLENMETSTNSNNSALKVNSGQTPGSREPISRIGAIYIYNRALTLPEVQENFDATKGRFGVA